MTEEKKEVKKEKKDLNSINESVEVPEGIQVSFEANIITVKGVQGELKRIMNDPRVKIESKGNEILFSAVKATKREKKKIKTFMAHIKNMFTGVTEGHNYELKVCASHFPMTVTVNGNEISVKNYLGEKVPRVLKLKEGVKVAVDGDKITVEATDKELAGQTAADIETLCKRCGFDRRIFQDGIYITIKDGKPVK